MATVYSLICWGGSTGKTATMTIASPCVVTITNHGLHDGTGIVFSTTGALPTGVNAGTTYYSKSTGTNTFNLYTDAGLTTIVNTSGSQSGTHTAKSAYYIGLSDTSRWSSRIYDGLASWKSARYSSASRFDNEVCEIGQRFSDIVSSKISFNIPCASVEITPSINGVYTTAYNEGLPTSGYIMVGNVGYDTAFDLSGYYVSIFGLRIQNWQNYGVGILLSGGLCSIKNMFINGGSKTECVGIRFAGNGNVVENCAIYNCTRGFEASGYAGAVGRVNNNLAVKCTTGFTLQGGTQQKGWYYNNLSVGNTTNWGSAPDQSHGMGYNGGETGNTPWYTGTNTSVLGFTTSDFVDYANNNFKPISTSPAIDSGTQVVSALLNDLFGDERPNYNNGANEYWDIGPFEYDHGYTRPATSTIQINNIVSGSRVLITRDDTSAVLYNDVPGTTLTLSTTYIGAYSVVIRKASASPYYREFNASGTTVADQTGTIKALQQLDE